MKYIIICLIVVVICIGISLLIVKRISKKRNIPVTILITICLLIISGFGYLSIYYHAEDTAKEALEGSSNVTVTKTKNAYFFDGPGEKEVIVFYPGAKVDEVAYAPLMLGFAKQGYDCFLIKMPFHMAFLKLNAADEILANYDYEKVYMSGHSLGGAMAGYYAASHDVSGAILLASYPTKDLGEKLVICIYGSNDKVMDRKAYENSKRIWPKRSYEYIIKGANHAGFGNYGSQDGDGQADIIPIVQQDSTIKYVIKCLNK